jgi:predicted hydrocarbon binding protein
MSGAPAFRDRLVFDGEHGAVMDQTRRYMLIRPEALMGLFRRLPEPARGEALDALAQSIVEQGSDSARAYAAMGGEGEALARTVAATAPQLGWGVWSMEVAPDALRLEVRNSPFAAGFGASERPVCHPIRGMMQAVATMVLGGPVEAREVECAACGAPSCRFDARLAEASS